ncbi:MAG: hypothetical protein ABIG96_03425 [Candidatus Micrarchaeota archaeon]
MKNIVIALLLCGVVLFGCTGPGPQPTSKPTELPTEKPVATVSIGPDIEKGLQSDADSMKELEELTKEIDSSGSQITDEDLNNLG